MTFPLLVNIILLSVTIAFSPLGPVYVPLIFELVKPSFVEQLLPPKKEHKTNANNKITKSNNISPFIV